MQRTCTVTAYDLLDTVVITASIKDWDQTSVPPTHYEELSCAATFPSVGADDPAEWLKDALVALIESL